MKTKTCDGCGKQGSLWKAKTKTQLGLCKSCAMKDATPIGNYKMTSNKASVIVKKPKPIPNISNKQKDRLVKYKKLRDEYMEIYRVCEAKTEGCTGWSQSIHHLKGRDGDNLFKYFMATCNHCHEKIERMGSEVYELGFKLKRTED